MNESQYIDILPAGGGLIMGELGGLGLDSHVRTYHQKVTTWKIIPDSPNATKMLMRRGEILTFLVVLVS
jgi:hypothetical protein